MHSFHRSILREYDIRGLVGKTLFAEDAWAIGRSFGTRVRRAGGRTVAVGYDGRLSSPALEAALIRGLTETGIDVVRIGLGPTPMLYYAEAELDGVDGGIQITGSHNPPDHNGFKMVHAHAPLHGDGIRALGTLAEAGDWEGGAGHVRDVNVFDAYLDRLVRDVPRHAFRIGWDAGNGAGGAVLAALVQRLPGEHHVLFTEIDGHFPNHHPDPTVEANLDDLRRLVVAKKLDFGVAFDGDADRLGAVDSKGRTLRGDQLLTILAKTLLKSSPGATVIADVKTSQSLFDTVATLGGVPVMWKTGHSLIKAKIRACGAQLGGEMTGHFFFADRWYGFDDGFYAALRLIEAVADQGGSLTELHDALPPLIATPELRFPVEDSRKFQVIEEVLARLTADGAEVNRADGARVRTSDGWWLLRASNTGAELVARAEAKDQAGLDRLLMQIDAQLVASGVGRGSVRR